LASLDAIRHYMIPDLEKKVKIELVLCSGLKLILGFLKGGGTLKTSFRNLLSVQN